MGPAVPLLAIGGVSGVLMLAFALHTKQWLARAIRVQGRVVALHRGSSSRGGVTYRPIVQYPRQDGSTGRFTDIVGSNPTRWRVGEGAAVIYDPQHATRAKIATRFRIWFATWFCALFTVIFGGVGGTLAAI